MKYSKVLSVHYPKAGGSSLKTSLKKLGSFNVIEIYDDDPVDPLSKTNTDPLSSRENAKTIYNSSAQDTIFHGHFSPRKFQNLDFDLKFTIIRHPVNWIISLYFFWSKMADDGVTAHNLYEKFKIERPSLQDFAKYPAINDCLSRAYFGDYPIENLDFVGIQERYQETIKRLSELLGQQLMESEENKRQNIDILPEVDDKTLNRLYSLLAKDISFYEEVKSRFWT